MGFDPQDHEVIDHLRQLKQTDNEYPPELLAARRQRFLRQMGELSLGVSAGASLEQAAKAPKAPPATPVASRILETVIVVAIIAEAGTVAYFYRDQLAKLVKTFVASAEVQEIISPPVINTSQISVIPVSVTPSPEMTATFALPSASVSPAEVVITPTLTGTPNPVLAGPTDPVLPAATQVNSTPVPNGNNGNHYGQTPKPERTKENNGNDNKPPKDPKPPKRK